MSTRAEILLTSRCLVLLIETCDLTNGSCQMLRIRGSEIC